MAGYTVAPAAAAALRQATQRWPNRDRSSDGTIGDPAHSSRTSDHNPAEDGYVYAFDLTNDPARGCDAHALVRAAVARRDPRVRYAISNGRIWSAARAAEGWRPYSGPNPHTKHAHVSITRAFRDDTRPWWPATPAPPNPEELDVDEATLRRIVGEEIDRRLTLVFRGEDAAGRPSGHPNLRAITKKLDALIRKVGA